MFRKVVPLSAVLALLLAVWVWPVGAQSVRAVDQTLFLTFVPNIQFAPVYMGIADGYFAANGINLSVENGDENLGVDLLAVNQRQFGVISGEEVLKARSNGRPVVFVYEWFQKYPVGVVVDAAGGIRTVQDLRGRKVGIPGRFGASYNGLTALLNANDMRENDIILDPIGFSAPEKFCTGQVEASVIYVNNEPLQIAQRAAAGECGDVKAVRVLRVSDQVDLVSNGLVTNEQTLRDQPDLVQGMVLAFDAGLRAAINNPAQAYLTSGPFVENLPLTPELRVALESASEEQAAFLQTGPSRAQVAASRVALSERLAGQFEAATLLQFNVLLSSIELWDADTPGLSDLISWEVTRDVLAGMGFLGGPVDVEAAFTDRFVTPVAE